MFLFHRHLGWPSQSFTFPSIPSLDLLKLLRQKVRKIEQVQSNPFPFYAFLASGNQLRARDYTWTMAHNYPNQANLSWICLVPFLLDWSRLVPFILKLHSIRWQWVPLFDYELYEEVYFSLSSNVLSKHLQVISSSSV